MTMRPALVALILLLLGAGALDAAEPVASAAPIRLTPGAPPPSAELVDMLAEHDQRLFDAVFGCRVDELAGLVDDDFEFLQDTSGRTAASGPAFIDTVRQGCARQKTGENFVARRELVPGSMSVHVLGGYGAMQMGTHRFFAVQPGMQDRLTESGRFIHVWKQTPRTWKLARVIRYDHRLAAPAE